MKRTIILSIILLFLLSINSNVFSNNTQVYVDSHNIDTKYHRLTCSFIPKEYYSISVENAFNEGFRRCPICEPPISDTEQKLKDEEYQERLQKAKEITNSITASTTSTTTNSASNDEDVVYVTSKGSKYHLKDCSYIDDSSQVHKIMLRTAISKGYVPCKACNPYGMAETVNKVNYSYLIYIFAIIITILIIYLIFNEINYKKAHYYKIPTTDLKKE